MSWLSSVLLASLLACAALAQPVSIPNRHERAFLVVPLVGAGTWADPKRPLFAPLNLADSGLISYTYELADNGQLAIVELVARDRATLQQIRSDARVQKFLEKGNASKAEIENELRQFKRDFRLDRFARSAR